MNWNQQVELCVSACECVHVRYFAVEMEMGKTVRDMFFHIPRVLWLDAFLRG